MNTIKGILEITLVVTLLIVGLVPVGAQSYKGITCSDVRALSSAERDYWSDRLNLSANQIHRIYVACYQNHFRGRSHAADLNRKVVNVVQ
jgi:hypothetical protein